MRSRFVRAAVLFLVMSTAVGCSVIMPKKLDMGGLETQLADKANAELKTTGITVSCPDGVKAESGGQFDCTATISTGETFTIRVTQTDSDGNVVYTLVDAPTPAPSSAT